jgi:hypothetical protein
MFEGKPIQEVSKVKKRILFLVAAAVLAAYALADPMTGEEIKAPK